MSSLIQRISLAARMVMRGGIGDVVAHFARARSSSGSERPGRPYRQVGPVRACVSRKAKALASMPMVLSTADDRIVESGPLFDLIDKPNAGMSRSDFWQATSAWIDLTGACHWVMPRETWRGSRPTQLVPVGAWQMKPRFSTPMDRQTLTGWLYRPAGARWDQAIPLDLDEVVTLGEDGFDPDDPFGFSSPLESVTGAVAQIWKADLANEASLDNGVEPGGAFVHPGTPGEDAIRHIREELTSRAGVRNRRRHMVLYGGMDWKQIASSFAEMEFSTLQKMKIVDVCAALDVDPAAVGYIEGGRFEFVKIAKAALWIDTVIPRAAWLASEFDRSVVSRFESDASLSQRDAMRSARQMTAIERATARRAATRPARRSLYTWFDAGSVPAVRAAALERSKEGEVWIRTFKQPPADVIEALDLPLPIHPWQRTGWQALGEMRVDELPPGDNDLPGPAADPADDIDPVGDGGAAGETTDDEAGEKAVSEGELARLWQAWRRSWSGIARQMNGRVARHFLTLRSQMLAKLEAASIPTGKSFAGQQQRDLIGEILFDLTDSGGKLLASVRPLIRSAHQLGGSQSMAEAAAADGRETPDPFNIADPEVVRAARRREIVISGVNRRLHDTMREKLAGSLERGDSREEIAEMIRNEMNIAGSRARTIAQTETSAAVEEARGIGRKQAGVPGKSWLWSRKETGRPWHAECEDRTMAEPIPNSENFTLTETGASTPYPRGPGLGVKDIVNCGCTTLARYPGDGVRDARLMSHLRARGFVRDVDLNANREGQ